MEYNKFNTYVLVRIILIIISAYILAFTAIKDDMILSSTVVAIIIFIQGVLLLRYIKSENRHLETVINHLEIQDISVNVNQEFLKQSTKQFISKITNIKDDITDLRRQAEIHKEFIYSLIENLDLGILVFNKKNEVLYANSHFKTSIGLTRLRYIADIEKEYPDLIDSIASLNSGENQIYKLAKYDGREAISITKNRIFILDDQVDIVLFNNIQNEMSQIQIESWQKLIRVLNHEIMNSISPITSLSSTNEKLLEKYKSESKFSEILNDVKSNNQIIEERSKNLIRFIDNYRKLTYIPKPNLIKQNLSKSINNVVKLLDKKFEEENIELQYSSEPEIISFKFDEVLLEQALINLLQNAIESFGDRDNKKIIIKSSLHDEKVFIEIHDNGNGIETSDLDKLFIPFFTTKDSGSGVGLTLCQQIMLLHNGNIDVKTNLGEGSKFILRF